MLVSLAFRCGNRRVARVVQRSLQHASLSTGVNECADKGSVAAYFKAVTFARMSRRVDCNEGAFLIGQESCSIHRSDQKIVVESNSRRVTITKRIHCWLELGLGLQ